MPSPSLKQLFLVSPEGQVTEVEYLRLFNNRQSLVHVEFPRGSHHSCPQECLKKMQELLAIRTWPATAEAWIIVDTDEWPKAAIDSLLKWSRESPQYHVAISNPCFELFLLLHFQETAPHTKEAIRQQLKKHLPKYDKHISARDFPRDNIEKAVARARKLSPTNPPPPGQTTVWQVVEKLLGN